MDILKVKKLNTEAIIPTRGTPGSAGLDVYTYEDIIIPARQDLCFGIGLAFDIPDGYFIEVMNKSGVATKKHCSVGACVVDSDYTGEVHVHLFNNSDEDVFFNKGQKVAQLVIQKYYDLEMTEVNNIDKVTERGNGGFGSTGV